MVRLERIQELFHGLILARILGLDVPPCLPEIAKANGTKENPNWFPVDGMYGGFSYWIESGDELSYSTRLNNELPRLHSKSWSRIETGSFQYHVITSDEILLVAEEYWDTSLFDPLDACTRRRDDWLGQNYNMLPEVIEVETLPNYCLLLTFDNYEEKHFDMTPYLHYPIFQRLQSPGFFNLAKVEHGTVVWPSGIYIAPEMLYLDSKWD